MYYAVSCTDKISALIATTEPSWANTEQLIIFDVIGGPHLVQVWLEDPTWHR